MSNTIPEGWSIVPIGDICNIAIGGTPSRSIPDYWDSSKTTGSPWVSIRDLNKPWIHETSEWITEAGIKHSNVKLVRKGTVLMSFKLSVGRVAFAGRDLYTNEAIAAFLPQKKNEYSDQFLYQGLQHWNLLENIDQAVKGVTLNKEKINQIETLLPPLPEQKKIAAILSSVDEVIEKTRAQIDKLKDLKTGMMQELLTKGIGPGGVPHTEFKDSPVGRIPAEWNVVTTGEIAKSIVPGRNKPKEFNGDIPWLTISDLDQLFVSASKLNYGVSREALALASGKTLPANSVIMTVVGEFGICAIAEKEVVINQQLHGFICGPHISPIFLCLSLQLHKPQMEKLATQTTISYMNKENAESVLLALPTLQEQEQIAAAITSIEKQYTLLFQKHLAQKKIKKALMQDLLTGKVRVQIDTHELAEA